QHAGKYVDDFAILVPVEARFLREGITHEKRQVDRTQQARPMRWQRLFATRIGGPDLFAEPVVVHLIDAVDENESRLGKIVCRRHDHVPDPTRLDPAEYTASHQAVVATDIAVTR